MIWWYLIRFRHLTLLSHTIAFFTFSMAFFFSRWYHSSDFVATTTLTMRNFSIPLHFCNPYFLGDLSLLEIQHSLYSFIILFIMSPSPYPHFFFPLNITWWTDASPGRFRSVYYYYYHNITLIFAFLYFFSAGRRILYGGIYVLPCSAQHFHWRKSPRVADCGFLLP